MGVNCASIAEAKLVTRAEPVLVKHQQVKTNAKDNVISVNFGQRAKRTSTAGHRQLLAA